MRLFGNSTSIIRAMAVILFSILSFIAGKTLAFQTTTCNNKVVGVKYYRPSSTTRLAGANNGGMDAFQAQLQAMHAEASAVSSDTTLVDEYANEMMDDSRSAVVATNASAAAPTQQVPYISKPGKFAIANLLMQRSIQTQLYYLADLRDEPTYVWLREFLNHNHLDDRGRFNELDGLKCNSNANENSNGGGWQYYLEQLEEAPPFTITVQLAPPRLSAQQMRNPFLAAQLQSAGKSYEETIRPSKLSQTLRAVARSLEKEWIPVLEELAQEDRKRVALFESPPQLQTAAAAYQAYWQERQVVAGGEGDDQDTPLHSLNCRIVTRFCTRMALNNIIEEIQMQEIEADEETKQAAIKWLQEFSREWEPKLKRGANDDVRRSLGIAPPGHWQRLCDGADADDVTEAMWQELPPLFAYENDDAMRLYSPAALAARLRRVRASVCDELANDLQAAILAMS